MLPIPSEESSVAPGRARMDWMAPTASWGVLGSDTRLALVTIEKNSAKV